MEFLVSTEISCEVSIHMDMNVCSARNCPLKLIQDQLKCQAILMKSFYIIQKGLLFLFFVGRMLSKHTYYLGFLKTEKQLLKMLDCLKQFPVRDIFVCYLMGCIIRKENHIFRNVDLEEKTEKLKVDLEVGQCCSSHKTI